MKQNEYHKKFFESFSSENIIGLFSRYSRSSKEITESWSMLEAVKKYIPGGVDEKLVIVVGDGASPRTASILAYHTRARVYSVDPALNLDHWHEHCRKQEAIGFPVQRIAVFKQNVEDCEWDCFGKDVVFIFPHSHAPMNMIRARNVRKMYMIALPCCKKIPMEILRIPHISYADVNILSPKNIVHIFGVLNEIVKEPD